MVSASSEVYFATDGGGIKAFSPVTTPVVRTVIASQDDLRGIAYDSVNNKIYYSRFNPGQVYWANIDGTRIETLTSNMNCEC